MKNKKFNMQNLFFSLVYMGLAISSIHILVTKTYLNFLTPKSFKYLIFMIIILVIFALIELKTIKSTTRNIKLTSSFVVLIPIILILIPNLQIDSSRLNAKYAIPTTNNSSNKTRIYKGESMTFTIEDEKTDLTTANSSNSFMQNVKLEGLDEKNKTITVSDEQFYDWTTTIFANQDKYLGYTITITGRVFKDSNVMNENQFVASRLLMSCCIADTIPAGLIAEYDDAKNLKIDTWLTVTGKLVLGNYNGQTGPIIKVDSIKPAEKPKQEFIFPK